MNARKKLDDVAGEICKVVLPIKQEYYIGGGKQLSVCTLSSMGLLEEISRSKMMEKIAVAGRLLSENKGIDTIIQFSLNHPDLKQIILCGKEVKGHKAGQALLAVHENGIDDSGRIIGAAGPYPILKSTKAQVDRFRRQVEITNMIGVTDLDKILPLVS
jgi:tetrahydromethanopterin S-methyltransferase subunit A